MIEKPLNNIACFNWGAARSNTCHVNSLMPLIMDEKKQLLIWAWAVFITVQID